jgi:hypothetical protein
MARGIEMQIICLLHLHNCQMFRGVLALGRGHQLSFAHARPGPVLVKDVVVALKPIRAPHPQA